MRAGLVIALVFLTVRAGVARADAAQATAAYDAKQYGKCAQLWLGVAGEGRDEQAVDPFYDAACCHALDGKPDAAFAALDKAVGAGFRDLDHLQADTDLASLRKDARWAPLLATVKSKIAAYEKTLGNPALRRELLALVAEDQAARNELIQKMQKQKDLHDPTVFARMRASDQKSTARMKEVIAKVGWPGKSLVGTDGSGGAWLLVQHADADPAFQKLCLAKMEAAVKAGQASGKQWAYLVDRVAVAEKRKQVYGTQFDEHGEPLPIEDEPHVDARRKAVGLGTLAEYKQEMRETYGPPR